MLIERLSEYNDLWMSLAKKIGLPRHLAGDVVQNMYLKIYELEKRGVVDNDKILFPDGGINKFYIWLVLRSMAGQIKRDEPRSTDSIDELLSSEGNYTRKDSLIQDEFDIETELAFEKTYKKVVTTLYKLTEHKDYPKYLKNKVPQFINLFIGYNSTDKSMRQIARETNVRLGTIHRNLNNVMELVRSEVGEDVQDFFNKDYHLL